MGSFEASWPRMLIERWRSELDASHSWASIPETAVGDFEEIEVDTSAPTYLDFMASAEGREWLAEFDRQCVRQCMGAAPRDEAAIAHDSAKLSEIMRRFEASWRARAGVASLT